ncbi:MAG: hypothetical protein K2X82_29030 [Gemmataceae bacterium]|nr:hypothetical protein [Gemmataceae bacterium]
MDIPAWFADILKQFPGLAVGLGIGYYVIRLLGQKGEAAEARIDRERAAHLASKDAEIARLPAEVASLKRDRAKWIREARKGNQP